MTDWIADYLDNMPTASLLADGIRRQVAARKLQPSARTQGFIASLQDKPDDPTTGIPGMALGAIAPGPIGQGLGMAAGNALETATNNAARGNQGLAGFLNAHTSDPVPYRNPLTDAALGAAQAKAAQIAFHGSPHDFTGPSTSGIGTGEGNQTYGWGLYGAEKPEVAEAYRRQLAKPGTSGTLHAWDVPENDNLLHYDKPLSQQPPGVMEKLKASGLLRNFEQGGRGGPIQDVTGETLYRSLGENDQAASMLLRDAGIPGMRYLDQGSRWRAGSGTHNFVLWDDSQIKPMAKAGSIDALLAALGRRK